MKPLWKIALIVLVLLILMAGAVFAAIYADAIIHPGHEIKKNIGEYNLAHMDGSRLKCQPGEQFKIIVDTNAGIPFEWKYKISDNNIVTCIAETQEADPKQELVDGGSVALIYVFEVREPGETYITFDEISIIDGSPDRSVQFFVKAEPAAAS